MNKLRYTPPEISPKELKPDLLNKVWFVHVRVFDEATNKWISKKFKDGVNSQKTFQKKKQAIIKLQKSITKDLAEGWNPLTNTAIAGSTGMAFSQALEYGLSKCNISPNSRINYRTTITAINKVAKSLHMDGFLIEKMERKHIKQIFETCRKDLKWSDHAYNKHLGFLGAILSQLVQWDIIQYNPAHKISKLSVAETRKYVPFTEKERTAIREKLLEKHPRFYTYVMIIFQTGIRPVEVLALKIKDIDLSTRVITIIPDKRANNSKTLSIRTAPINDFLLPMLKAQIGKGKTDMYLFGSPFETGKGNRSTGTKDVDFLSPSMVRVKRDTLTKLWNQLIIKEAGINKHLYAAKHSGADAKILAGVSIDALQDMYGHSSKLMTRKYITKLKEVYHKEILDKSTDF